MSQGSAATATTGTALTVLALLVCAFSQNVLANQFPDKIEKCHIKDEKCMVDQANTYIRTYPHGIPELGSLNLEPFHIDELTILGDEKSPANVNLYLKDLNFHNYSGLTVLKLRGFTHDTSKPLKIISQINIPEMTLKAKYKVTGKILVLPITGEGDLEWVITGTDARTKMVLEMEHRDGKVWPKITDYKVVSKIKKVKIHMTNLFHGDKALAENMLKLLNDNDAVLTAEISPKIDEAMSISHRAFLEKFFGGIPYEDFFLPDEK